MGEAGERQVPNVRRALATGYGGNAWTEPDDPGCGAALMAWDSDEPLRIPQQMTLRLPLRGRPPRDRSSSGRCATSGACSRRAARTATCCCRRGPVCGLCNLPTADDWVEVGPTATLAGLHRRVRAVHRPDDRRRAAGAVRLRARPLRRLRHERLPPDRRDRSGAAPDRPARRARLARSRRAHRLLRRHPLVPARSPGTVDERRRRRRPDLRAEDRPAVPLHGRRAPSARSCAASPKGS